MSDVAQADPTLDRDLPVSPADLADPPVPGARGAVHAYICDERGVHGIPVAEASRLVVEYRSGAQGGTTPLVWLDVLHPGETEAHFLRDELGLHPLAVEDCIRGRQRPKLERYPGYYFLVFYAARVNPERGRFALNEVHIFIGDRFLITVHDHRIHEVSQTLARWRAAPGHHTSIGALAHALIDVLVDDYFPILDHFGERVEAVEVDVLENARAEGTAERILTLRRELALFRRIVTPERDVLSTLVRRDLPFQRPELLPYFQDVHDHIIRVVDEVDSLRELLAGAMDAQYNASSNQLNQTVRKMTAWSIVLMSMSWIAGVYGMNFDPEKSPYNMPELGMRFGYPGALTAMVVLGVMLLIVFRKRKWI